MDSNRGAQVEQVIRADEVARLEARRLAALARIAQLRIAVECDPLPTSCSPAFRRCANTLVGQMLADQPDLRVVAATDNPAIHRTDLPTENRLLAASAGMGLPRRTVLYLEGYASRMGGRPLENVPRLTDDLVGSIVRNTPEGDRLAVLQALYARWPVGAPPDGATAADAASFETAVRRIMRGVIY